MLLGLMVTFPSQRKQDGRSRGGGKRARAGPWRAGTMKDVLNTTGSIRLLDFVLISIIFIFI
jgi:hypothetical protein